MRRTLLLALGFALVVAGCMSDPAPSTGTQSSAGPTPRATPRPDDVDEDPLFLLVEETFFVNTSSSQPVEGDFGPHCENVRYERSPPSVELIQSLETPVPTGILVRHFDATSLRSGSVSHIGSGLARTEFEADASTARLFSPFEPERVVLTIVSDGGALLVDGQAVSAGSSTSARADYVVQRDGASYQVAELFRVTNMGRAPVSVTEPLGPCD